MKKIIALVTVLALAGSGVAYARSHNGGFQMNGQQNSECYNRGMDNHMNRQMHNNQMQNHGQMNGQHQGYMGGNGGFQGTTATINLSTVAAAKQMNDDSRVMLKGYIIESLGDEEYTFKDDSGTITVEISNRRWNGQTITPTDLVEIRGKVDRDKNAVEIDVKRIIKVAQ